MTDTPSDASIHSLSLLRRNLAAAMTATGSEVLGKQTAIRLAFTGLLAGGHLLLEDLPGMGKTTLARTLAVTLGLSFQRIQFTSDLMPGDILGVSVFDRNQTAFEFRPGPVFTETLLADEINRASPRTQSALLEAMAEGQVTVDGTTHALPDPFFVIATQNPVDLDSTFQLPASQMDRFIMRLSLGYPSEEAERLMLHRDGPQVDRETTPPSRAPHVPLPPSTHESPALRAHLSASDVVALRRWSQQVPANDRLLDYLQALIGATRTAPDIQVGMSPRASLALLRAARAWAFLENRSYVAPEDVQAVFPAVAQHRLIWKMASTNQEDVDDRLAQMLKNVPVPI